MEQVSQDIERLIVRRLDGVLTEDEALQLNRELIRNPEAQRLLEDYTRVDAMASAALEDVLVGSNNEFDVSELTPRVAPAGWRSRYHRGWWLVPGAVAAALLALMIPKPSFEGNHPVTPGAPVQMVDNRPLPVQTPVRFNNNRGNNTDRPIGQVAPSVMGNHDNGSDLMRNVSQRPSTRRRTGREVMGVMGDDGNLYWIEVDRTRTVRQKPTQRRSGGFDEL